MSKQKRKDKIITWTPSKAIIKLSRIKEALTEEEVKKMEELINKISKHDKGE